MKSYLSLIPISSNVCKRKNRMTIFCIIISVFLVTSIFSMADMSIRTQTDRMLNKHGNWHLNMKNISQDIVNEVSQRSDVKKIGLNSKFNVEGELPYKINEKHAVLYGTDKTYMKDLSDGVTEGTFPVKDNEVMVTPNSKTAFNAKIGDNVTLHTPAGDSTFTISGFGVNDKDYYDGQTFLIGVYMTENAFNSLMVQNGVKDNKTSYYLQFTTAAKASNAITELKTKYQLSDECIAENTMVMGMAGQSNNTVMQNIYGLAAILFVLVLLAGVLMISGSMNSNVAQRTQFFGMMRCIGASRQQIIRFVRLEALNWCKTAVPIGVVLGTITSWAICIVLHYGIGGEFATTPIFKLSPVGIISGIIVGIVTVILAAQSPAKHAAKVSPIAAISGNSEIQGSIRHTVKFGSNKIERLLGINHAFGKKKNWLLMTMSFALTIILVFSFSVILDFAKNLIPGLNKTTADLSIISYGYGSKIDRNLVDEIKKINGVSTAYGLSYMANIPTKASKYEVKQINIVSYDDFLLNYSKGNLSRGNLDELRGNSNKVATIFNRENPLRVGDTLQVAGEDVEITGVLSQGLFGDQGVTIICSQEIFDRLMGNTKFASINIYLSSDANENTISQIRSFEQGDLIVSDQRKNYEENRATYLASRVLCYGFLGIIGLISMFNIVNSISMSVSARIKQYGAMRAVGMDNRQLTRMISAEAFTFAISGLIVGCGIGIPLNRYLHNYLLKRLFGLEWHIPFLWLGIICIFVVISTIIAVYTPIKRICNMSITDTINEL